MAFFQHEIIRKYTLALLSTFNDIETQYLASDGITPVTSPVPIKFGTREKAMMLDEYETKNLIAGRTETLPKLSLVFNTFTRATTRTTSKFQKINRVVGDTNIQYQYNSTPYDFSFDIVCMCRGMSEAAMIAEQVASYFNPTVAMKVNEVVLQESPTSIIVDLADDIAFEPQEYDEYSQNIVTVIFPLNVRGNIYQPIKDKELLEKISIYLNMQEDDEFDRASLLEWDGMTVEKTDFGPYFGLEAPVISNITRVDNLNDISLTVEFEDADNQLKDGNTFIWNVIAGTNTIGTGSETVLMTNNSETTTITVQVVDARGNQSNLYQTDIVV